MPTVPEEPALSAHLRALRLEKGLSHHTIESYRRDLLQFQMHLQEKGLTLLATRPGDIVDFLAEGAWRPATRARKSAAIRSFYRAAVLTGLLAADPTRSLPATRLESNLPRTLTVEEVARMLDCPKADPGGLRDRALLETLYGAGLRVSEALDLRLQDIDLEVGFVRTIGKGDKERVVPLGRKAIESLLAYNQRGRPFLGGPGILKGPELFLNKRGGDSPARACTRSSSATSGRPSCRTTRRPTRCVTPSRHTCWRAAPICARCRRCSDMPTSRPRRSTLT